MLNRCEFIGNVGKAPEVRFVGGNAVASFSVACNEKWTDKGGTAQERTEWVRCTAWGKLAEVCGQYLGVGRQVYVSGRMQTKEYEKDGVKRYSTEIVLDTMKMLGKRDDAGGGDRPAQQQRNGQQQQGGGQSRGGGYGGPTDDDLPF